MEPERFNPLGYQDGGMHKPQELPADIRARNMAGPVSVYFRGLERLFIDGYGQFVGIEIIMQSDLESLEMKLIGGQRCLARNLSRDVKEASGLATRSIGGPLFGRGEASYFQQLGDLYQDALALKRLELEARAASYGGDKESVLRSLITYVEQHNGRTPDIPIRTLSAGGQTYAEHFDDVELGYLVVDALDQEISRRRPVTLPENGSYAWRKLGCAVADRVKSLSGTEYLKGQAKLADLRKEAVRQVAKKTTRVLGVDEKLLEELLRESGNQDL